MATYDYMINSIMGYYEPGSDIWQKVMTGTATGAEVHSAFSRIPQMQVVTASDGATILGYDWRSPSYPTMFYDDYINEQWNNLIDSNIGGGQYTSGNSYNLNVPGYATAGGAGGNSYNFSSGASYVGGSSAGSTAAVIADRASLALTGVNIGAKLGMKIDDLLYNIDPEWWDTHYPTINPQTWPSMCTTEFGKSFVRTLFGIRNDEATAYVSAEMLAQTYMLLRDEGAFNTGAEGYKVTDTSGLTMTGITQPVVTTTDFPIIGTYISTGYRDTISVTSGTVTACVPYRINSTNIAQMFISDSPFSVTVNTGGPYPTSRTITASSKRVSIKGRSYTYYYSNANGKLWDTTSTVFNLPNPSVNYTASFDTISYIIFYGDHIVEPTIPGISKLPNSTVPDPNIITGTTIPDVLSQLRQNYPTLFDGSIQTSTPQQDGTLQQTEYVPVPFTPTDTLDKDRVTTGDITQTQTPVDPQTFIEITTKDPTNTPPTTGTGSPDSIVMPTGNASSLWAVYHPSQSQLNAFGAWLWSSDFVDQIKRLFVDPMQAIIGVHKVFAPIPTGGNQNIKCGYLDSGVSSPTVSSQYTEVNCGTVHLYEYFGNVFDYDPHTKISIYLPFIGVVPLKTSEVMRASITVKYGVDVITGACLAMVSVSRDGSGGVMYSYGGSCACHYPISSGSYAGIVSGIVTSALGIAGGVMTGSPLAAVGGAVAGVKQMHADVSHSGGFTGCAGAMGPKIPYLIITRPQSRMADNIELFEGKPSNAYTLIGDCTGFVRATEVHFSSRAAFDDEAKEVEALLKSGVLISD